MASATATKNGRGPRVPLVRELPTPEVPAPEPTIRQATPSLDAAVLRVQAKARPLLTNADGQIQGRTYRYVTLSAVTDEVLPLLVEEQLVWKVFPTTLDGKPALRYAMTHVPSGESDEDTMALLCEGTMQGLGSGITYGRRYALVSYLNLTIDEDDDGRGANLPATDQWGLAPRDKYDEAAAAHAEVEQRAAAQPAAAQPKPSERRQTEKQRGMLEAKARAAGLDAGAFANVVLVAAGEPERTWRNAEHASQTLGRLLDQLPARLVTPVKNALMAEGGKAS